MSSQVSAYTLTINSKGQPLKWAPGQRTLVLAANPTNSSGLSDQDVAQATVRGMRRWTTAALGQLGYELWMGKDPAQYATNSGYNGQSSLYFLTNSSEAAGFSSNILGLTQVWFSTQTGEILETDIVLNDRDFQFTTQPTDTSALGRRVFIENVLTHELGHAYGMGHAGGMQSTMLFVEAPEQAKLGCDDQIGIQAHYPASSSDQGSLFGRLTSPQGSGLFGVNVVAVSLSRGAVLGSALSDKDGSYRIEGLEAGTYVLYAEPYFAGASALPSFYSAVNSRICSGSRNFGRTLLSQNVGGLDRPVIATVAAGSETSVAPFAAKCTNYGESAFPRGIAGAQISQAPVIMVGNGASTVQGAIAESFSNQSTQAFYRVNSISGRLEIHGVGFSIYSPAQPTLTLLDANGSEITSVSAGESYHGVSGFTNHDWTAWYEGLPYGDYWVRADFAPISSGQYPAGYTSLDSRPYFILTVAANSPDLSVAGRLPASVRCTQVESQEAINIRSGSPPRRSTTGAQTTETTGGFCGTIDPSMGPPSGGGPNTRASILQILGWFTPWAAMLGYVLVLRLRLRARRLGKLKQKPLEKK